MNGFILSGADVMEHFSAMTAGLLDLGSLRAASTLLIF
jgi:hypothetical protein